MRRRTYEGFPLGYYRRKLEDLKDMWGSQGQVGGYLLKLPNLQQKCATSEQCDKLNMPNASWEEETLESGYLEALPGRMNPPWWHAEASPN